MSTETRRRQNGQPQACEPCRKSKIRCDHKSPNCSRCVLRNLNCVYHPAPMTKHKSSSTNHNPVRFVTPRTTITARSFGTESSLPSVADPESLELSASYDVVERNPLFQKEVDRHQTTRFSAVFFENQESFIPVIRNVTNSNCETGREPDMTAGSRMELAINTLMTFPTARTCDMLMTGLHHIYDIWLSPTMIQQCLEQVWREYRNCLGVHRTRESVSKMANDLFLNDKKLHPISSENSDASFDRAGWVNWFSGTYLRWEMIGILFSWAGIAFKHKPEWDSVFKLPEQQTRNCNAAADKMRECANACVRLCEYRFEVSDIMVICMKNSSKLQSLIINDESDRIRVDFGTVGSAFITAGLHRLPSLDKVTPFSQYRACIASSMYYLDKCESLFNARPPMLSRRYCQYPLPLDLCEEDLYGGREKLAAALARLDSNGWNTDGRIYTTTWLRALSMLSPIREGILELSLSVVDMPFTKLEVESLIIQLRQIVASYPSHIQYHRNSEWPLEPTLGLHSRSAHEMYIITRIQLDVLQCHFLLQRLLVSRQFNSGQELFDVAQETISIIVSLWQNRDQLQELSYAFNWITVSYGMPCAGILCIELLRACNLAPPSPATDSSMTAAVHSLVQVSRSEVVQNLTMFGAVLDWIRPTNNNAQLSRKFKKVLQRIIDTVFDSLGPLQDAQARPRLNEHQTRRQYGLQDQQSRGNIYTTSEQDLDPAQATIDDMDWLNTVDWTQGGWLEQTLTTAMDRAFPVKSLPSTARCLPVEDSTVPFWHRDIHELHDHRTTEELPASSDVVIIGAGYAGISTAYHLVKEEAGDSKLSVTILEARGVCSGATGRNGGHLRPDMYSPMPKFIDRAGIESALEVTEFEVAHLKAIKSLVEREKIDCDFTLTRSIDVWCNEGDAMKSMGKYDMLVSRNLEYIKDVFFVLGKDAEGISGVKGAKACASFTAATLWPYKLILHLTKLILETGLVNLQTHTPVMAVTRQTSGGFIITTPRGATFARKVVYANNAYVSRLLPQYSQAIVPCKGLCTHISVPEGTRSPLLNNSYIVREREGIVSYLIPRADGSIVVGGANLKYYPFLEQWYDNVDDSTLIEEVKDYYDGYMQRNFHGWEETGAKVDKSWTGVMGYSWDSLPHVGALPGESDQYVLAGFNGHGMPVVYLSALGIAKMIRDGVDFKDTGVPRLFQTTLERLNKIENGPAGGDILARDS
ncbi:FAD dependent oxidoreductase superfamily [Talaromyces stipitatus ATCC 10500]|uniref:FAD dependent oxidoreductase superfamily n=1 Tax=Talaromyces stipitatus (strain ATCC 10500 / CBS 375.48 / QM 6759 / NRRL 1006) TaxID=441959 RepID=B8LVH4_TALSN|nr:FAD dependent oxidoreductase superfamily [Talaromyces stipitatus ATCC 10500]EED23993.1 FAD dependent oxidoreductase superfamily [Talaromyces stipitatus ATCC 10500]